MRAHANFPPRIRPSVEDSKVVFWNHAYLFPLVGTRHRNLRTVLVYRVSGKMYMPSARKRVPTQHLSCFLLRSKAISKFEEGARVRRFSVSAFRPSSGPASVFEEGFLHACGRGICKPSVSFRIVLLFEVAFGKAAQLVQPVTSDLPAGSRQCRPVVPSCISLGGHRSLTQ